MARTASADTISIKNRELKAMLREVVREELERFANESEDLKIEEGSVLWHDLIELKKEAREGRVQLLTHDQVFAKK